jgi:hypothetical protein
MSLAFPLQPTTTARYILVVRLWYKHKAWCCLGQLSVARVFKCNRHRCTVVGNPGGGGMGLWFLFGKFFWGGYLEFSKNLYRGTWCAHLLPPLTPLCASMVMASEEWLFGCHGCLLTPVVHSTIVFLFRMLLPSGSPHSFKWHFDNSLSLDYQLSLRLSNWMSEQSGLSGKKP